MPTHAPNPYVGPVPFSAADRHRFFGRDDEVEQLIDAIYGNPVVLFCAESGAGKTSLLHARLVPDMKADDIGFEVLPVARVGRTLTPATSPGGANPYIFNLLTWLAVFPGAPPTAGDLQLADYLAALPRATRELGGVRPRLLVIDQFEEVLTTFPEARDRRRDVFVQLQDALDRDSRLSIVLALREDHLAGIRDYRDVMTGRLRGYFHMRRLGREAATIAVTEPARLAGRPFDEDAARTLVDELSLEHEAGREERVLGEHVEPVQLQVVCWQLWENLRDAPGATITAEQVQQFGNVDRVLETFYEAAIASLGDDPALRAFGVPEAQVRAFFSQTLVTRSGIRARVDRGATHTGGLPNAIVEALENRHVIRAEQARGGVWYELVHDRLIDPVLRANEHWEATYGHPLLQQATIKWLASPAGQDRQTLLQGVALREVRAWVDANPHAVTPEQREYLEACVAAEQAIVARQQKRRWQYAGVAVALLLVVALATVWRAVLDRHDTHQQLVRALWLRAQEALDRGSSLEALHLLARIGGEKDQHVVLTLARLLGRGAAEAEARAEDTLKRAVVFNLQRRLDARLVDDQPPAVRFEGQLAPLASDDAALVVVHEAADRLRLVTTRVARPARAIAHAGLVGRRFSPGGGVLVTWGAGVVRVWPVADDSSPVAMDVPNVVDAVVSPSDDRLVTLDALGELQLWTSYGDRIGEAWHDGPGPRAVFSPSGRLLVSWGEPDANGGYYSALATATVRQASDARPLGLAIAHERGIVDAVFSPDDSSLVTWGRDATASLWTTAGQEVRFDQAGESLDGAAYSPDGRFVATWSQGAVRIRSAATGAPTAPDLTHDGPIVGVRWNPDVVRHEVLTWGDDRTIRVWEATSGRPLTPLPWRHDGRLVGAEWCGPRRVLAWSFGGLARVWDLDQPTASLALPHQATIRGSRCAVDDRLAATWGDDHRARVWMLDDVASGPFELALGRIVGLAFDGAGGVTGWGDDGHVRRWWISRDGWPEWDHTDEAPLGDVRASVAGDVVAAWTKDGAISVRHVDGWREVWSRAADPTQRVVDMTMSADGLRCAAWWQDATPAPFDAGIGDAPPVSTATLAVWDFSPDAPSRGPERLAIEPAAVVLSPDGQTTLILDTLDEGWLWTRGAAEGTPLVVRHDALASTVQAAAVERLDPDAAPTFEGGAFNGDGSLAVTWGGGDAYLWRVSDAGLVAILVGGNTVPRGDIAAVSTPPVHTAALAAEFSAETDDAYVVSWGPDTRWPGRSWVRAWRADSGQPAGPALEVPGAILRAVLVDGGRRLVAWTREGAIVVANVRDGAILRRVDDGGEIAGALWNAHRQGVLTWRADGTVRLWLVTGELAFEPLRHSAPIRGVQTTGSGEWFLTWTEDGVVHLWSSTDGGRVAPPMRHGPLAGAFFTSLEQAILSWGDGSADGATGGHYKRWDISADYDFALEALPTVVRALTGADYDEAGRLRVLTHDEWRRSRDEYERIAAQHQAECRFPSRSLALPARAAPTVP